MVTDIPQSRKTRPELKKSIKNQNIPPQKEHLQKKSSHATNEIGSTASQSRRRSSGVSRRRCELFRCMHIFADIKKNSKNAYSKEKVPLNKTWQKYARWTRIGYVTVKQSQTPLSLANPMSPLLHFTLRQRLTDSSLSQLRVVVTAPFVTTCQAVQRSVCWSRFRSDIRFHAESICSLPLDTHVFLITADTDNAGWVC